jgi:hypothetical protein
MKHPVGDVVILDEVKNLSFINVSRVGQRVKDPVRIQREILSVAGENHFLVRPSHGIPAQTGKGGEALFLFSVEIGLQIFQSSVFIQRRQAHSLQHTTISRNVITPLNPARRATNGVQGFCKHVEMLDCGACPGPRSGIRRNDEKHALGTFREFIM